MLTQAELRSGLSQFTQIDGWYQHWVNQFVFSDGIKWLCDQCECRWLLTEIAFFQMRIRSDHQQIEPFQVWHLKRLPNYRVRLQCRGVNNQIPLIEDELRSVKFPLDEVTLWLINGMLLLPNEYSGVGVPLEMMV
ncbi:MAG: hypothetical protein NW220_23930 [Leptolyngbyaceae cyanobacterium bins.349]|nr:hypothetical protein [Leptolyngbyaceae cyanobacterium bins.349]